MTKNSFVLGYQALPANEQNTVRQKIMEACFWYKPELSTKGLSTFYKKLNGTYKIKELEAAQIEKVFAPYGISPWTGKKV